MYALQFKGKDQFDLYWVALAQEITINLEKQVVTWSFGFFYIESNQEVYDLLHSDMYSNRVYIKALEEFLESIEMYLKDSHARCFRKKDIIQTLQAEMSEKIDAWLEYVYYDRKKSAHELSKAYSLTRRFFDDDISI